MTSEGRKILTVVGARPQFIKAAVVSSALSSAGLEEVLVHTGQHYDANMSDVFFSEMGMAEPAHNLGIGGGSHGQNTGRMIEKIEALLQVEKPAAVMVYGDTDSTLAGALAAVKLHIPVAHVEAGLRSWNRAMPEEINRVLTDHASDLLFTTSDVATGNLAKEGIAGSKVIEVGDVMYDAALNFAAAAEARSTVIEDAGLTAGEFILATIHRQENTDHEARLAQIMAGLARSPLPIVWPLHPRTRVRLCAYGIEMPSCVKVIDPVGYLDMIALERGCRLVLTDSGGVQKEAYYHGKPCLILRDQTEWLELVAMGWAKLAGADADAIARGIEGLLVWPGGDVVNVFGDGRASHRIATALKALIN